MVAYLVRAPQLRQDSFRSPRWVPVTTPFDIGEYGDSVRPNRRHPTNIPGNSMGEYRMQSVRSRPRRRGGTSTYDRDRVWLATWLADRATLAGFGYHNEVEVAPLLVVRVAAPFHAPSGSRSGGRSASPAPRDRPPAS
jgi:hypothetical protein